MEQLELELLKNVLPEPFILVNNDTALWDPDEEQQLDLEPFDSAREVIAKLVALKTAYAFIKGQVHTQYAVKTALGITDDIRNLIQAGDP